MRTQSRRRPPRATLAAVAAGTLLAPLLSGCWVGAGGAGSGGDAVNVLMVNNPQMVALQKLTAAHFTKDTGIKVNFTVLPENDVRDKISQDFANQAGQYDVATLSNYEIPIYARNGWLKEMGPYVEEDPGYDEQDVLKPMRRSLTGGDGKLYGQPFYGESSFLMYRKDLLEREGLTMPDHPTWKEVGEIAAKLDGAEPGMKGICLRGLPGWGEVMAPLTTVVNTFGGTWFDEDWNARLDSPEWLEATKFYVGLVREHGEAGAAQSGFAECLNNTTQGKTAMWYDATSAAGSLESADSPVKGKMGYAPAPVEKTESAGWLYTWAWGIQNASRNPDNAWKFVSWASGKEYEQLVGDEIGWSDVPAGKRASTYENPDYRAQAAAFQEMTRKAIEQARPDDPGVQPRPAPGIQFVGIPEFTDLGTQVSQEISAAIAGRQSVESALKKSQQLAEEISEEYEGR
ncbi:sugar ABC transporter substrate-binding protein [Streptomyces sp. NBC_01635]|uniref:ABC transporter substrate-binding protein n=1 Tax=Streptomyces sp. NBC_01635 TaxID=2975904 RepID=UPI003865479A|nr:sugar ABC transporter substrate-binding protein [Streptomyces sp. NBC_01635]